MDHRGSPLGQTRCGPLAEGSGDVPETTAPPPLRALVSALDAALLELRTAAARAHADVWTDYAEWCEHVDDGSPDAWVTSEGGRLAAAIAAYQHARWAYEAHRRNTTP